MTASFPAVTARDRELLDRLSQSEPLSTSELCLLFFIGVHTCRDRLVKLEAHDLLLRVYPARSQRGGRSEALWFLSPAGRRAIGAPARRPPSLSIPDLEHRRAVARFFLALIERSTTRRGEGLYRWLGEQQAQDGTGASASRRLRPIPAPPRRDHFLPRDRPRHRAHPASESEARRLPPSARHRPAPRPRERPARLREWATASEPRTLRARWTAVGMGQHRQRALPAATHPRAATPLRPASLRIAPTGSPCRGLSRPALAPALRPTRIALPGRARVPADASKRLFLL